MVLVPFYRGAVVFITKLFKRKTTVGSRPLLSRSGCISQIDMYELLIDSKFSSPFIEERLYLNYGTYRIYKQWSSRPLLSRSGCIFMITQNTVLCAVSSRPLLSRSGCISLTPSV